MYQINSIKNNTEEFISSLQHGSPYKPLSVKIKLTWNCNLSCVMCNSTRQMRGTELGYKRVVGLVQELAEMGCKKIHFSGGEPLLWEGLFNISVYARNRKHIKVNLTTNGTLLNREMAKKSIYSRFKTISISLDSPDESIHDRIRGTGNWRKTIEGIKNLVKEKELAESGTKIRLNVVVSKLNYKSLHKLPEMASYLGIDYLLLIPVDDHLGMNFKLNYDELLEYNTETGPALDEKGTKYNLWEWPDQAFPFGKTFSSLEFSSKGLYAMGIYEKIPCFAPWLHSFISPRGRVFICCMTKDVGVLGKIKKKNFKEIWEGDLYKQARHIMLKTRFPECFRCDSFLKENIQICKYLSHNDNRNDTEFLAIK